MLRLLAPSTHSCPRKQKTQGLSLQPQPCGLQMCIQHRTWLEKNSWLALSYWHRSHPISPSSMCSKVDDPKPIPRSLKTELNTNAEPKESSVLPIQEPHHEASYIFHTLSIKGYWQPSHFKPRMSSTWSPRHQSRVFNRKEGRRNDIWVPNFIWEMERVKTRLSFGGAAGSNVEGPSWIIRCCPQRGQDQWLKGDFVTGISRQEHDSLCPPHLEMGFCSAVLMTSQSQWSSCLSLLVLEYRYTALHLSSHLKHRNPQQGY